MRGGSRPILACIFVLRLFSIDGRQFRDSNRHGPAPTDAQNGIDAPSVRFRNRDDRAVADDDTSFSQTEPTRGAVAGGNLLEIACAVLPAAAPTPLDSSSDEQTDDPHVDDSPPGMTTVTAIVDTGAQATVMSFSTARRARIAHLIDHRYGGRASGVGSSSVRIVGRIPRVRLLLGQNGDRGAIISVPVIVLENTGGDDESVDLLLGLDALKDVNAGICLRTGTLTIRQCERSREDGGGSSSVKKVIPFVSFGRQNGGIGGADRRNRNYDNSNFGFANSDGEDYDSSDGDEDMEGFDLSGM